ncbi:hypothetical protein [Streptomyces sp. NBC_00459]|uniref:hypothetical protein n=1 Tax=Streptomyces sp. NBC_00459 TaxID=2975749 RepID=UPI002E181368
MEAASQSAGQTFEAILAMVGRSLDDMATRQHTTGKEVRALSSALGAVQEQIAELDRRTSYLNDRFTEILAETHQQEKPGTLTQESYDQFQLAEDLKTLFADIDHGYRTAYQSAVKTPPTAKTRAQFLCNLLNWQLNDNLDCKSVVETRLWPNSANDSTFAALVGRITALRRGAGMLDPSCEFSFDPHREKVEGRNVETWGVCNPANDVQFAVTPSFLVGSRCLLPQQVYTEGPDVSRAGPHGGVH